ncbi:hypothetical protein QBC34DRAFT_225198 [Podospora aff. communis PSN243]|uniref:Nephrocystin 3-like N-terminal domain-containing protein n=1 Tax=Podospora aff. communis PSN243 TaxID=3040156 RepID=A0AAV9G3Q3_9PEZI|nr:hypothetical protein QBC34DRAFT_225198 [Podospora aff. communis PSN243]
MAAVSAQGISVLHDPANPTADIVFVHGFTGHPRSTWTLERSKVRKRQRDDAPPPPSKFPRFWRRQKHSREVTYPDSYLDQRPPRVESRVPSFSSSVAGTQSGGSELVNGPFDVEDVYWPYHLLPSTVPSARILTYGYDTRVRHVSQGPVSQNTLHDHAWDLLWTLEAKRRLPQEKRRPLILVAHSLGGLVVKEMLKSAQEAGLTPGRSRLHDVFLSVIGLLFFGTPHRGADPRAFLHHILAISAQGLGVNVNKQIVGSLMPQVERQPDAAAFAAMACQQNWVIYSFQEEYGVPGLFGRKVVDDQSSCLDLPFVETVQHIGDDHMDMCRFHNINDAGYQKVAAALELVMENTPAAQAGHAAGDRASTRAVDQDTTTPDRGEHVQIERTPPPNELGPQPPGDGLTAEQRQRLLNLLPFDQLDARLMTLRTAQSETCAWFLSTPEATDWEDESKAGIHAGLLWIKGKAGAGKSVLMKYLFSQAKQQKYGQSPNKPIITSFFFNARGGELEQSSLGCYRSILLQLVEAEPGLEAAMDHLSSSGLRFIERHGWNVECLTQTLVRAMGMLTRPLKCFIDALDECDENEVRDMVAFFEHLGEVAIASETSAHVQICFSSRHYPSIVPKKGLQVTLEDQAQHRDDIARYIDCELRLEDWDQSDDIKAEVLRRCSNIFLWAALVVPILNREYASGRKSTLSKRLDAIPPGLDELFDMILTRDDDNADELHICLQWVLFSAKPLTPQELFIAVQIGLHPWSNTELDSKQMSIADCRRYVDTASKGLAEVVRSSKPTVQFIHESVRDFLLGKSGKRKRWPGFGVEFSVGRAHELLKACCMTQLERGFEAHFPGVPFRSEGVFVAAKDPKLKNARYPFLHYAVENVLHHANLGQLGGCPQLSFLGSFPVQNWVLLHNLFEKFQTRKQPADIGLLYILAAHNLTNLIRIHPDRDRHLDMRGGRYGYPVLAAIALRHAEALRELMSAVGVIPTGSSDAIPDLLARSHLSRGHNYEDEDAGLITHLVRFGHTSLLERYIETHPQSVKSTHGRNSQSPLFWAHSGALTSLLLSHGADPNFRDVTGLTPLLFAIKEGRAEVSDILLSISSVDINARCDSGFAAVHYAANNESFSGYPKLVEHAQFDPNIQDYQGQTALHNMASGLSIRQGLLEVARALIGHSRFDPNIKDNQGRTLLHVIFADTPRAPSVGPEDHIVLLKVARLLIDHHGFDPNTRDPKGRTAIHVILEGSRSLNPDTCRIVNLYLENPAFHLNSRGYGKTILHLICSRPPTKFTIAIARSLIENPGIDYGAQDDRGETALDLAFGRKSYDLVRLFLKDLDKTHFDFTCAAHQQSVSDVVSHIRSGAVRIHSWGVDGLARMVARYSIWNPEWRCADLDTILTFVGRSYQDRMISALNRKAYDGWSPLWYAASLGRYEYLALLLKHYPTGLDLCGDQSPLQRLLRGATCVSRYPLMAQVALAMIKSQSEFLDEPATHDLLRRVKELHGRYPTAGFDECEDELKRRSALGLPWG